MTRLTDTIPRPFDSFIGRAEELQAVKGLLATHRLVTLTGAAGIGKTRLALRISEELAASYPDGGCFVPLLELTDPERVPQAVAAALGLREQPDRSLLQTLTDFLAPKELLLVWDNCDYLVQECRTLAQALLGACPQVKILATSRRSLRVRGESLYAVPSFSVPNGSLTGPREKDLVEAILAYEAPRLFKERAGDILTGFEIRPHDAAAVVQICRQLDGIPLAVELAAARIRELSVQQIADRLDERFRLLTSSTSTVTHQQTLKTAVGWSYDLLSEAERTMLARLSVFAGGWDLEAAERVCSDSSLPTDQNSIQNPASTIQNEPILDLLTGLIDQSWVVGETGQGVRRYRFLETIREYSRERLAASGEEAELRACHAEYFLKLAEEADADLKRWTLATWLDRLENDYENMRAALGWCLAEETRVETALRLARALARFWEIRGYLSEGRAFLAQALEREGASGATQARAAALNAAAVLAWMQGDAGTARSLYDESLAIERSLGDASGVAWSLHHLGHVASERGEYETARGLYDESLTIFRELDNQRGIAVSLSDQGNMALKQGHIDTARSFYEESLRISRERGNKVSIAVALNNLGKIAREQGDNPAARALHTESLLIRRELGDRGGYPWSLEAFARLAAPVDPRRAARLWGAAEALRESLVLPLPPNEREEYERHRAAVREALGEEQFAAAWSEGRAMSPEQATDEALQGRDPQPAQLPPVSASDAAAEPVPRTSSGEESDAAAPALLARPLPVPLTPFVGREIEIAQVRGMLETPGTRLVTLTGLGGTGKTRLALEVARVIQETRGGQERSDARGGVGFVSLVDLADARLIGQSIQEGLSLPATGAADPLEAIVSYIGDHPFLLVLDNFEPLLPEGAAAVRELLERAPRLVCLVTSRLPLGLADEEEFPVAPLPVPMEGSWPRVESPAKAGHSDASAAEPALSALIASPSVQLFASRAQAVRPEFQVTPANGAAVAQLCRALDGIPLALELAAAWSPVLTPAQMLRHLTDRFRFLTGRARDVAERHRTLRAVLDWSFQSLPQSQQRLLSRLSVFRGGWTLEAAAAVAGSSDALDGNSSPSAPLAIAPPPLLDELTGLQNASLVLAEETGETMRFRMLETVREYGEERLAAWGEAETVRARHQDWYLALAEQAEGELERSSSALWLDRLEAERENLRAALTWSMAEETGAEAGLRLAGALGRFWELRGYTNEGRSLLAEVLRRDAEEGRLQSQRARMRAKALLWAGVLSHAQADYPAARAQYEESLSIYPPSGDRAGTAAVLYRLGNLAGEQGEHAEARRFHEESLWIRRALGDVAGIAVSLNSLGNVAVGQGDYETARSRYAESQALSQQSGDRRGWCWSRHLLGVVAEHEGDLALARSIYEECLPVWRELRSQVQVAWALHGIGYAAYQQGDFAVARYRLAESLTLFREMDYTGGLVRTLERLGGLAAAQGEIDRACRLLAAAASQRAIGARTALSPPEEFLQDVAAVRSHMEPEAFAAAWAEGHGMTLEQAIEYALHEQDRSESGPDPAAADRAPTPLLLTTKLVPPALSPSLLPRPRLMARLNQGASTSGRSARLVLLDASPGSGKSSLVSQWYHQQPEGSVAWLSLDHEDSEPGRLLLYLCAAIETVAPAATPPVRSLLPTAGRAALEYALTLLLNGVSRLERPVTLVLDDFHEIEGAPVHHLVAFLVEHLPPTLFLILTTRSDPPLPLARLRLQGQLIEIRDSELRFTHEEATGFLNECMGLALTPEMVQRLADRTEGWVAGLQMAALSLQDEPNPSRFLDALAGTHRYLVEYLFEEVLQRQPPDVRTFLGETALLDRLCGPLCDAVTKGPGGQAMLERFQAANLFLVPLDREGRWYRYHHLFADVLRARLMPSEEAAVAALHGRAAAWFEEHGMIGEAIQHALSGQQLDWAAHLIEQHVESLRREGEEERLAARLEQLLEAGAKQSAPATALRARVLLARLHWQAGRHESAVAVLEPALRLAGQEEHARALGEAGPALAPILRHAAQQGIAPETVGPLLSAIGGEQRSASPSAGRATPLVEPLSERELEVLRLLTAGLANAEIAKRLFLAVGTVKRHVFNIYGKLGVTSRTSAVARARELGLL